MVRESRKLESYGFTLTDRPKPFAQMDKRSQRDVKRHVRSLMDHLGIEDFHFGAPEPKQVHSAVPLVVELLRTRQKDGTIHFYDVVKQAVHAGVKHADLTRYCQSQAIEIPISQSRYSKIHRKQLSRPSAERVVPHAFSSIKKNFIREFWLSSDISRVCPNKRITIKRGNKKTGRLPVHECVYYRQYFIGDSYKLFKKAHFEVECSRTSFYRYKPKSKQDVCQICKAG